jgi:3-methylfumaryl-CoA hydratase
MFEDWIGREERASDIVTRAPAELMAATLNRTELAFEAGQAIPPVWHWLYFLPLIRTEQLGPDGHPPRGDFLPPVLNARRMRAGGKFTFIQPLRVGDEVQRRSLVNSVVEKAGASGALVFVGVSHEISRGSELCVLEEESIVYRKDTVRAMNTTSTQVDLTRNEPPRKVAERNTTTPTLLFRFSALTFNSHRIHYDLEYAKNVENYPGLVVQGPLIALLLLEHLHRGRPPCSMQTFEYRSVGAVFCGEDINIVDDASNEAERAGLRAVTTRGTDAVIASAAYASA